MNSKWKRFIQRQAENFGKLEEKSILEIEYQNWVQNGFKSPAPLNVKWEVLKRWGRASHWIETGTLWGETSNFLSGLGKSVITIEASESLASRALAKFAGDSRVQVLHGLSEELIDKALQIQLEAGARHIALWLDGHYSGEGTHKGPVETPISFELESIAARLNDFETVTVFIDDIRLFNKGNRKHEDYPQLATLVNWALNNGLESTIELDILIASNDMSLFEFYANG